MKRGAVIAVVAALAGVALWRSLTLYSNVDHGPTMDPTELTLVRRVLTLALAGDSAGATGLAPRRRRWAGR